MTPTNIDVLIAIQRIENKIDALGHHLYTLVQSLAEEEVPSLSLDGAVLGRERDETQPL